MSVKNRLKRLEDTKAREEPERIRYHISLDPSYKMTKYVDDKVLGERIFSTVEGMAKSQAYILGNSEQEYEWTFDSKQEENRYNPYHVQALKNLLKELDKAEDDSTIVFYTLFDNSQVEKLKHGKASILTANEYRADMDRERALGNALIIDELGELEYE